MRTIGLLLTTVLLTAFQCQRWTRYARDIVIRVDPQPLTLLHDTITFKLIVSCNDRKLIDSKPSLTIYALTDEGNHELAKIELASKLLTKTIKEKIDLNEEIKNIGVLFKKGKYESPVLQIVDVHDNR